MNDAQELVMELSFELAELEIQGLQDSLEYQRLDNMVDSILNNKPVVLFVGYL